MKYAMILIALVLGTQAAHATQADPIYKCTTQLPAGSALLYFNTLADGSTEVTVRFNKNGFSRPFAGTFKAEITQDSVIAQGVLNPKFDNIQSSIQGYFKDNKFYGLLYASHDHRIEFGYGNPLDCTLAN